MTRTRILAALLFVSACAAPLTPIAAQTARDTAHAKKVIVAADSLAAANVIIARQVAKIQASDSAHAKNAKVATDSIARARTVAARQLARIRSADSSLVAPAPPKLPKLTGLSCDSLAKVLKFNGGLGTTVEIQKAFDTCAPALKPPR